MQHHYPVLDSTNEEAKRLFHTGKITGLTTITAARQTQGKGTRGRVWVSPPGCGLYLSIVHPMTDESLSYPPVTPLYTLAAGVACAEALEELTPLRIQLKPINDLYLADAKLGGILTEGIVRDGRCVALITGIGINLREHTEVRTHAERTGNRPTCLAAHLPQWGFLQADPDGIMEALTGTLTRAVDGWYRNLWEGRADRILDAYLARKLPGYDLPERMAL